MSRVARPPGESERQSQGLQPPPRLPSVHRAVTTHKPLALLFLQGKVRRKKGATKKERNRRELAWDCKLSLVEISFVSGSSSFPGTATGQTQLFPLRDFTPPVQALLFFLLSWHHPAQNCTRTPRDPPQAPQSRGSRTAEQRLAPLSEAGAAGAAEGQTDGPMARGTPTHLCPPPAASCSAPSPARWLWGWRRALPPSSPGEAACPGPSRWFSAGRSPSRGRSACNPAAERQSGSRSARPGPPLPAAPPHTVKLAPAPSLPT